jgi:pimeloyl-ACP methyl ester carboxylesterase
MAGTLAYDGASVLPRIQAPTLLLWGDRDAVFSRAQQERLLALLPDATLRVYPETGHALHWEQPERFTEDLTAFIASRAQQARPGMQHSAPVAPPLHDAVG